PHPGHGLEPIGDAVRLEAFGLEVVRLERSQLGFVFDDQDALHCAAGRESETRKPPSGEGAALISPSCASAMLRQMASPRPVPPFARAREASTRWKRSKSCGSASLGTPGAESSKSTRTRPPSRCAAMRTRPPRSV